ncbi:phage portal protein, lambda family [Pseudoxanthobacter soli DSM 19599]|uniref:Phage portal protein, lambda family n=1 Tax=Pseudoxanthobacter soli DSM 19599 TaxID=1123029 RepID=A0A1M7ZLP8_9HYPH|nr:phage portal protein [Pseudoxanthobacter soli]SHO65825.1 phage portal protein, lambda family [Pseudoxanthobacter soli DSM 19599]
MSLLGRLFPRLAPRPDGARRGAGRGPSASYLRGGNSPFLFNWRPVLRDSQEDVRVAWVAAASRAIDAIQNSGWLAGGVDIATAMTVGVGLRLNAQPDADALGVSRDEAQALARRIERRFYLYASRPEECDISGRMALGQLAAQAYRSWIATGEVVGTIRHLRTADSTSATKLQLIPSHRLSQETRAPDMIQGVRFDTGTGRPRSYRFRLRLDGMSDEDVMVLARDSAGRPQVVHVFDGAIGQVRGITPLAPALQVVRQYDQLSNATLTAALIQAIFAATLKSDAPSAEAFDALRDMAEKLPPDPESGLPPSPFEVAEGMRADWYAETKIDLGEFGKITHLPTGDELEFHGSEHPNSTYEAFAKFLLREIARCLGVTVEQLTGDYSGATYSSVRMATEEIWKIVEYRREHIIGRLYQMLYEAWLEEEIESGRIAFPGGLAGFWRNRAAATLATWRGPVKPTADDKKTAQAWEILLKNGVVTEEMVCAAYGIDWEDKNEQLAREARSRRDNDLPPAPSASIGHNGGPALDDPEDETEDAA